MTYKNKEKKGVMDYRASSNDLALSLNSVANLFIEVFKSFTRLLLGRL